MLTRLAIAHGHDVTAFVHRGGRFPLAHARLHALFGDALSPRDVAAAVAGHDAIISVLAPTGHARTGKVFVEGTRMLADAAAAVGIRRIIVVSAEGAGVEPADVPLPYRFVLRIPVVARMYPDLVRMERELEARTDLHWTVVRPALLTNGRETGRYRTVVGDVVPHGLRISRADLAGFLLHIAESGEYVRQRVAVAD
jgi:putative NADH-flavin reductase